MRVFESIEALAASGRLNTCLAIGFFDGVHLGHQQVIRHALEDAHTHGAVPLGVTFDRHPATIVAPDRAPPLIYSREQCFQVLAAVGVRDVLVLRFDREFSLKSGREFVSDLAEGLGHIRSICVGANFTFGYQRSGNVDLLKQLGGELGFAVHGLAAVSLDDQPVSSTRIRQAIREGNFDAAGQMLGRGYSIAARVLRGDGLGTRLGFPTANLDVEGLQLPPSGVYTVLVRIGDQEHRGALNIGCRPTLNRQDPKVQAEVHLLEYSGDLYGRLIETSFVARLRGEKKFSSLDELRSQISRDVVAARNFF